MITTSNAETNQVAAEPQTASIVTSSRSWLASLFDVFVRHAGVIAVDHTHMPPLDRVSGRTGLFNPPVAGRCC
jgi:hypothetical protein